MWGASTCKLLYFSLNLSFNCYFMSQKCKGKLISFYMNDCLSPSCKFKDQHTRCPVNSLFMVVEDINGSSRSHEPNKPAHVSCQRAELTQVQPDRKETEHGSTRGLFLKKRVSVFVTRSVWHSPRCVGGSDEEVDDHSVAHVETLLHGPETHTRVHIIWFQHQFWFCVLFIYL